MPRIQGGFFEDTLRVVEKAIQKPGEKLEMEGEYS
jgi:hypothetical protein